MAQKNQLQLTDPESLVAFMESLDTADKLLENSMQIYSIDTDLKRSTLENLIRFGDLTLEQLSEENHKLHGVITAAMEHEIPLTESHQNYLVKMSKLVRTRLTQVDDPAYENRKILLEMLDDEVSYPMDESYVSESLNPFSQDVIKENLMILDSSKTITARGLFEGCNMLCSPYSPMDDSMITILKSGLIDKVQNTMKLECKDDRYCDFPLMQAMDVVDQALKDIYADIEGMDDTIDELMAELDESITSIFEEYAMDFASDYGFNPNPFNVYNLTPFPVGVRTVNRAMTDLINADEDEVIEQALINLGKIYMACEAYGPEILTEKDNAIKKVTRNMAHKSEELAAKAGNVKKDKDEVKDNLSRTVNPMTRFMDETFNKMKKADQNERRNMIIKGGLVNKTTRYLKRGIAALIAGNIAGGPIIGAVTTAITILASIAVDKEMDKREKNKILQELENELAIVNEKIDDSRGDEDKAKKYELMRIKAKLQKDIDRITLGLKY